MKIFFVVFLFLIGCSEKTEYQLTDEYWLQRNIEGEKFSKTVWGKCFKSWAGYTYLLEKNDGSFLVDGKFSSTQFCTLFKVCDYTHKDNCIIKKSCNEYADPSFVEQKMKEMKLEPIKCLRGIK